MANLIGKKILVVDEVDDTRTTLDYAIRELQKDVETAAREQGRTDELENTQFSIFVLHVCSNGQDAGFPYADCFRRTKANRRRVSCHPK